MEAQGRGDAMLVAIFNLFASPVGLAAILFIGGYCFISHAQRVARRKAAKAEYPKIIIAPMTFTNPNKGRW